MASTINANMPDFDARMKEAVVQRLRTFSEPLANEMKVLKVHYHAVRDDEHWVGQPGGLIGFINREGIELAVLGVRSTWNITDFLMGSTAERVCRDTACSILTVRSAQ